MTQYEQKILEGASISFGTNTQITPLIIINYDEPGRTTQEVEDVDLGSTVKKSFPSAVVDEGELSFVCRYYPGISDPATILGGNPFGADELITITYPLRAGQTTPRKKTFQGHITKADGIKGAVGTRCERAITIKVNSKPADVEPT